MEFIADLHVHSKYSRATAKNLDLEHLYKFARIKGVNVVGTGDFTFPAWVDEISEKLEPAEPGLFVLKPEIAKKMEEEIPSSCKGEVRFILQTEISNIYKKDDRVRKNHNLIFFPDLDSVKRFNLRLGKIGNITSDGRPILGLDAANLLEIMLETSEEGFFIPAHIWTPWFSMFGSKSGFDSIDQCFGSLSSHIFAVETGLSSDPPMNHRVADLDNVRLVSNSDAHSPGFLGRNATVFDTDMDYFSIRKALETNDLDHFKGTYDMYPHQGKYHYDGHRKCNVCLNPEETLACGGICPECGRPLTLGVLYRVQELADRPEGFVPEDRQGFTRIVPLKDILSELCKTGPNTKKVNTAYDKAISSLGPELSILVKTPVEKIASANIPLLSQAIEKIRKKTIHIDPGYDGEYGRVAIFSQEEREKLEGTANVLFSLPSSPVKTKASPQKEMKTKELFPAQKMQQKKEKSPAVPKPEQNQNLIGTLNEDQKKAVLSQARAMIIQAGPGTGKTRTLTAKIAWLISEKNISPNQILALTFTAKAAEEVSQRIQGFLPQNGDCVTACTFHSLCLNILRTHTVSTARPMDAATKKDFLKKALKEAKEKTNAGNIALLDTYISQCKQQLQDPASSEAIFQFKDSICPDISNLSLACVKYQELCQQNNLIDFEGILFECVKTLENFPKILAALKNQYKHIFVDEYQDVNLAQYQLTKLLAEDAHILVIGDRDQSIYGFRGSDFRYFDRFETEYPDCEKIVLQQNYRSTQTILDASWQMISRMTQTNDNGNNQEQHTRIFSNTQKGQQVLIQSYATDAAEITGIGKMIENLVGGLSFFSFDAEKLGDSTQEGREYSFSDMAILCRTRNTCQEFAKVFQKQGIPFHHADRDQDLSQTGIDQILACFQLYTDKEDFSDFNKANLPESLQQRTDMDSIFTNIPDRSPFPSSLDLIEYFTRSLDLSVSITGTQWFSTVHDRLKSLADIFPNPRDFLDNLALAQDQDSLWNKQEAVSIMTMHTAKGLEFPVVFVAGCEDGLIPFSRSPKKTEKLTENDLAEEKRLFYVAMTRAKELLCLTHAAKRRIYGKRQDQKPSCFLDAIEKELAQYEVREAVRKKSPKDSGHVQMELW